MAAYALVVLTNANEGKDAEFNDWYTNQHLGDVLNIPGFTQARRFKLCDGFEGQHKYLALYEMETDDPAAVTAELQKRAGTPAMFISPAMDMNANMSMFQAITPMVKAK